MGRANLLLLTMLALGGTFAVSSAATYRWDASSGLLPPWPKSGTGQTTLAGSILTVSTTAPAQNAYFLVDSTTDPISIEFRGRFVSGVSSSSPPRTPMVVQYQTAPFLVNYLFIQEGQIFLLADDTHVGMSAAVPTSDAMHTYRIIVSGGAIQIYYDGIPALTGNMFMNNATFDHPAILWGEGSGAAYGTSEWEYFQYCAGSTPCLPTVPGFTVQNYVSGIPKPYRLAFSPAGDLFVGNNTNAVSEWADRVPAGGGSFSPYGNTPYHDPDAVAYDALGSISGRPGSLLVGRGATIGTGALTAVLPDQSVVDIEGPTALLGNPDDLVFDRTGRLLITDYSSGKHVLAKNGIGSSSVLFSLSSQPATIAVDANNNIYTSADDGNISIHAPDGTLLNSAFLTGLPDAPLDFGPGGCWGTDLYTVNNATHELLRVPPSGVVSVIGNGFSQVVDLAFSPDSLLYLSMYDDSVILKVSPIRSSPTAPSLSAPVSVLQIEGAPISIGATATDPDGGDVLTLSATGAPASLTYSSTPGSSPVTGLLSGTLGFQDAGTYTIVWSVTDGACGWTTNRTTTLTVLRSLDFFTKWTSIDTGADLAQGMLGSVAITMSGGDITFGSTGGRNDFSYPPFCPPLPSSGFVEFVGTSPALSYTITFSAPVQDPILHIASLASTLTFSGVTLTKICGQSTFTASDSVVNGSFLDGPQPNDANGTVKVNGLVSSLTFTAFWAGALGFTRDGIDIQILAPIAVTGVSAAPVVQPSTLAIKALNSPVLAGSPARISFALPSSGPVVLRVYNVRGEVVNTLVNEVVGPGEHLVAWDGQTKDGARAGAGVYFLSMSSAAGRVVDRVVVLK